MFDSGALQSIFFLLLNVYDKLLTLICCGNKHEGRPVSHFPREERLKCGNTEDLFNEIGGDIFKDTSFILGSV
jgi:hypothetical protein